MFKTNWIKTFFFIETFFLIYYNFKIDLYLFHLFFFYYFIFIVSSNYQFDYIKVNKKKNK